MIAGEWPGEQQQQPQGLGRLLQHQLTVAKVTQVQGMGVVIRVEEPRGTSYRV